MSQPDLLRRSLAELLGTFALVMAGCGAIVVNAMTGQLGHVGIALTFGFVVVVMVAATGHLSGAHLNPAVTLAFAVSRHFPWRETPAYIGGQLAGAVLAAGTLRLLFGVVAGLGATVPSGPPLQSLVLETLLTAALMFVITAVATDTRAVGELASLAIGFTVAANALWAGPISGASMNPARSFGPALVAGVWQDQWIYWVGPIVGAIAGALLYQWVRRPLATPAPALPPDEGQNRGPETQVPLDKLAA
ncbi:MAG: MIP family channel protein [Caldilineaceae bacterium]